MTHTGVDKIGNRGAAGLRGIVITAVMVLLFCAAVLATPLILLG
jgi:hypothetical protein